MNSIKTLTTASLAVLGLSLSAASVAASPIPGIDAPVGGKLGVHQRSNSSTSNIQMTNKLRDNTQSADSKELVKTDRR